ncbi:MAG TPA: helicase-associated domain-containing protein [Micromonosporaceae bacterium]|nr:helicase-associated domain-containing protein [Micromonosporaceae bacterium]
MASPLARWLATLDAAVLADILVRRPEAANPPPADLAELAARLQDGHSVDAVLATLPLPAVQLIEVAAALGGPSVSRDELAAAVGRTAEDPDVEAALHVLAQRALVWPDEDGRLRMAGVLWSAFASPLGLGPPARLVLEAAPSAELRDIARRLGLSADRPRAVVAEAVRRWLSDADAVRAVVAAAPAATRELLHEVAFHGSLVEAPQLFSPVGRRSSPELSWAVERGLLVWDGWQHAEMPHEVGLALRGPGWHAPFDPHPPEPELLNVDPDAVAREAAAAAAAAVAHVSAILDSCAGTPLALLKAGGVGARELRRLEKATGADPFALPLFIEVAFAAGLLAIAGDAVLPTEAFDGWRASEPADRLVPLLTAWRRMTNTPLMPLMPPVLGGPVAPLRREPRTADVRDLRPDLLRILDELPAATALADPVAALPLLRWRVPLLVEADELGEVQVDAAWLEAALLGVVAHGALSPLGRALTDEGALSAAAATLLPPSVGEALFQADLTAIVPGTPAAALAELLDAAADRESHGSAGTWRFGAASVRRAFDGGYAAEELLAQLRKVAVGGHLPQPLEYLIGDIARSHGAVRVRAVGCVLHASDPALLAEIAGTRALRPLRLTLLAPTVLASTGSVRDTLAALREAGFAPVREDAEGMAIVERAPVHRAPPHRRSGPTAAAARGAGSARRSVPSRSAGPAGSVASPGSAGPAGSVAPSGSAGSSRSAGSAGSPGAPDSRASTAGSTGAPTSRASTGSTMATGGAAGSARSPGSGPSSGRPPDAGGRASGAGSARRSARRPGEPRELAATLLASSRAEREPAPGLAPVIMLRPGTGLVPGAPPSAGSARGDKSSAPDPRPSGAATPANRRPAPPPSRASGNEVSAADAARAVTTHAGHLDHPEQVALATAITRGTPIRIEYTTASGRSSSRTIEPLDLDDHLLIAWCHLRDGERAFALDRIDAVHPA